MVSCLNAMMVAVLKMPRTLIVENARLMPVSFLSAETYEDFDTRILEVGTPSSAPSQAFKGELGRLGLVEGLGQARGDS